MYRQRACEWCTPRFTIFVTDVDLRDTAAQSITRVPEALEWDRFLRHVVRVKHFTLSNYKGLLQNVQIIYMRLPRERPIFHNLCSLHLESGIDMMINAIYLPLLLGPKVKDVKVLPGNNFTKTSLILGQLAVHCRSLESIEAPNFGSEMSHLLAHNHFKHLKAIRCTDRAGATYWEVVRFAQIFHITTLRTLSCSVYTNPISKCDLESMGSFPALETLDLFDVWWLEGVPSILRTIKSSHLRDISIVCRSDFPSASTIDQTLESTSQFKNLQRLVIDWRAYSCRLDGTFMIHHLFRLPLLEDVNIRASAIPWTNQAIIDIGKSWPNLKFLTVLCNEDATIKSPPTLKLEALSYVAIHLPKLQTFRTKLDAATLPSATTPPASSTHPIQLTLNHSVITKGSFGPISAYISHVYPNAEVQFSRPTYMEDIEEHNAAWDRVMAELHQ